MSDFTDICEDSSHEAVHYDAHGYMKCDIDKKYVYADGRQISFANPKDQERYQQGRSRLIAVYGFAKERSRK